MKKRVKKFIPNFILSNYYYAMEFLAALRFGFPGKKLQCIGVTGTKGKSTTVFLITRILEEAGFKTASISSIEFRLNGKSEKNELKMGLPSRQTLQRFLRKALDANVDYCVVECTSEGLAQRRVDFVHFIAAVFTNLAPEHIESHGSYELYREAKGRLFQLLHPKGIAVLNQDDPEVNFFVTLLTIVSKVTKMVFFSLERDVNTLRDVNMKLEGKFNQYNALAAATLCKELGIKGEVIKKALENISVIPGRLEEIKEGQNFRVFVDYAHNPYSLQAVLTSLLKLKTKNQKLIVITGAQGGGRDKWKRPEMGKIAATYADVVIITNEDPYQENPEQIIEDVYKGMKSKVKSQKSKVLLKILDRKEAIERALKMAREHDIVVITGKGSESVMETAKGKIPWNEREIVKELLKLKGRINVIKINN